MENPPIIYTAIECKHYRLSALLENGKYIMPSFITVDSKDKGYFDTKFYFLKTYNFLKRYVSDSLLEEDFDFQTELMEMISQYDFKEVYYMFVQAEKLGMLNNFADDDKQ